MGSSLVYLIIQQNQYDMMTNDMTIGFNPEILGFRFIHVQVCILAI